MKCTTKVLWELVLMDKFIPLSINVPQPIYLLSINIPFSIKVQYFKTLSSQHVKFCLDL